jgi:hypothetical protein
MESYNAYALKRHIELQKEDPFRGFIVSDNGRGYLKLTELPRKLKERKGELVELMAEIVGQEAKLRRIYDSNPNENVAQLRVVNIRKANLINELKLIKEMEDEAKSN